MLARFECNLSTYFRSECFIEHPTHTHTLNTHTDTPIQYLTGEHFAPQKDTLHGELSKWAPTSLSLLVSSISLSLLVFEALCFVAVVFLGYSCCRLSAIVFYYLKA